MQQVHPDMNSSLLPAFKARGYVVTKVSQKEATRSRIGQKRGVSTTRSLQVLISWENYSAES
jgi:hypothetical protein